MSKALRRSVAPLLTKMGESISVGVALDLVDVLVKEDEMRKAFEQLYSEVGTRFGRRVHDDLQGKSVKRFEQRVFNDAMLRYVATEGAIQVVRVTETTKQTIRDQLQVSVDKGEPMDEAAGRISKHLEQINTARALRIARTEIIRASNYGAEQGAIQSGVENLVKEWIATPDGRVRPSHAEADRRYGIDTGKPIPRDELFIVSGEALRWPGDPSGSAWNTIHCILPDNEVQGNFIAGYKSKYSGLAYEIITVGGKRLTVTANHPILTEHGFVAAHLISRGDNLIAYPDDVNGNDFRLVDDYINEKPTTAEQVFGSLSDMWLTQKLMPRGLYFDGDAEFFDGQIEVVIPDGVLMHDIQGLFQAFRQLHFETADTQTPLVVEASASDSFRHGLDTTTSRSVGGGDLLAALGVRHLLPFKQFGLSTPADFDAVILKMASDTGTGNANLIRQMLEAFPSLVSLDKVAEVRQFFYQGHVYDFTSLNSTIIAKNIYISNCRCSVAYTKQRQEE